MPKVSVIVPIYNVEKYLEKCINSLLSQTLEDIQIILVNDGSKDNSGNIAKECEKNNKNRIIYVKAKDEKIIHICRKKIHIRYYLQENVP